MRVTNEDKIKIFYGWLGQRFNTFEQASEGAPISFLAKDNEDKEYFVYVQVANEISVFEREKTGIAIENTHFYNLYAMMSQGQNVFWFEAFENGYFLFYLNDCLTPEQLNVLPEQTLIGVASALHVEKPTTRIDTGDGKYAQLASTPSQPTIIQGSPIIGRKPKTRVSKRKK
jgi:hypothetical protein